MSTSALQRCASDKSPRAATMPGDSLQRQVGAVQAEGRHPELPGLLHWGHSYCVRGTSWWWSANVHASSSVSQQHFTSRWTGKKMVLRCDFRQSKEWCALAADWGSSVQGKSSWNIRGSASSGIQMPKSGKHKKQHMRSPFPVTTCSSDTSATITSP